MELELDRLGAVDQPVPAPRVSTFPVATQDVALVVESTVPAAEVEAALRDGAGELLESLRLFDVYEGPQIGEGRRSLAYALRFRAPDRTLTVEETTAASHGLAREIEKLLELVGRFETGQDLAAEVTHRERTNATQKTRPALKTVSTRGVPSAVRKLEAIANEQGWEEF